MTGVKVAGPSPPPAPHGTQEEAAVLGISEAVQLGCESSASGSLLRRFSFSEGCRSQLPVGCGVPGGL